MELTTRVLYPIASGGQGRVFAAALLSTLPDGSLVAHPVALKRPHDLRADHAGRFVREAKLAASISSAHVVPVLGVSEHEGTPSLVLQWVEGVDLQTLLESGPLPPRVAVRIVLDAAAGLAELHARGVTHRDVAPDNLLVGADGITRVSDLGLVRAHDHRSTVLTGKAAYVSPETIRGEPATARSDVFVLAAILVECLLGRAWFRGQSDAETLERVQRRPPPDALEGADMLVPLVRRALDGDPIRRPSDARDLAEELVLEARTSGVLGSAEEVAACVAERCAAKISAERTRRERAIAALQPVAPPARHAPPRRRAPLAVAAAAGAALTALAMGVAWPHGTGTAASRPITARSGAGAGAGSGSGAGAGSGSGSETLTPTPTPTPPPHPHPHPAGPQPSPPSSSSSRTPAPNPYRPHP